MFHIGDVIKKLRAARHWTIDDLVRASGVSKMTISGIERGERDARRSSIDKIAVAFGFADATGLYAELRTSDQSRHTRTGTISIPEGEVDPDFDVTAGYRPDDLPMIAEGEASPEPRVFWDREGRLLAGVTDRISRPAGLNDPQAYGVRVRGDSMLPVYRSGQSVVVSPSASIDDGDRVYVALKDGSHLIKVARRAQGGWLLESTNPAYGSRFVKTSDIDWIHPIVWAREKEPGIRVIDEQTGKRR